MKLYERALVLGGVLSLTVSCDAGPTVAQRDGAASPMLYASTTPARGPRLEIVAITAAEAEDGRGGRVTTPPDPRALDVHASTRGRALDPVLRVGGLHFHDYTFPSRGVMRFVVDDVARLRAGDEVSVQWGDDASSRIVLSRSLEVPK